MSQMRRGTPVTIVTPKWKISQLCDIVRGEVDRHWLTPEEGRRTIRDGKTQMVYTPPRDRPSRPARSRSRRSR